MNILQRLKRGIWTYKQPITKIPKLNNASVSDLFIWRNSDLWKTFFELSDISGFFLDSDSTSERYAKFCFFDNQGELLFEKRIMLICNHRQTIDLSVFLLDSMPAYGTFCVFHSYTPKAISELGSFITERGYVSYCYRNAPLRSYVHGNLDAVCQVEGHKRQLLGANSFLLREYKLQNELIGPARYELGIVNPSARFQRIICQLKSIRDGRIIEIQEIDLSPGGSYIFSIKMERAESARIIISSHLVMARPLVFRIYNNRMDVFHG